MADTSQITTIYAQITNTLLQQYSLPISQTWLRTHLPLPRPQPQNPTAATPSISTLTRTVLSQLLTSDLTISLAQSLPATTATTTTTTTTTKSFTFPPTLTNTSILHHILRHPVPAQLLAIEDIGSSRWSQIEALERVERGEMVRGREVVRSVDVDDVEARGRRGGSGNGGVAGGGGVGAGPHKYVLQDAVGRKVVAFEIGGGGGGAGSGPGGGIEGMRIGDPGCAVGMKVVVKKGAVVRRGLLMLGRADVRVLGGKVETWDEAWKKGRKKRLLDAVEEGRRG